MTKTAKNAAPKRANGEIRIAYYLSVGLKRDSEDDLARWSYETPKDTWGLCDEGRALRRELEYALHLINTYCEKDDKTGWQRRDAYCDSLVEIAKTGLVGRHANPAEGLLKIESFSNHFLATMKDQRSIFARETTVRSFRIMFGCALFAITFWLFGPSFAEKLSIWGGSLAAAPIQLSSEGLKQLPTALFVFFYGGIGLALGEIFTAKRDGAVPSYEAFDSNPRFRFSPAERWVFVFAAWGILLYLIANKLIVIGIGDTHLHQVMDKPLTAPLLGILTTISFNTLVELLTRRSGEAFKRGRQPA